MLFVPRPQLNGLLGVIASKTRCNPGLGLHNLAFWMGPGKVTYFDDIHTCACTRIHRSEGLNSHGTQSLHPALEACAVLHQFGDGSAFLHQC